MLQSILGFFAVTVLTVVLSSPVVQDSYPEVDGWNALLGPRSFFEGSVNTIQTKSSDDAVILGQLKQVLDQNDVMTSAYMKYRTIFKKTNDASRERLNQLKKAMLIVARHNLEAAAGKHSWTMAVNHFADMSSSELSMMSGTQSESDNSTQTAVSYKPKPGAPAAPASLNYVEQGVVSSVKSQGQCSTCAMFAATSILESADARTNSRKPQDLSPQELADCYTLKHFDCNSLGSDTRTNLQHLVDHGVASLADYPYTAEKGVVGPCKKDSTPRSAQALSFQIDRDIHTEETLMELLAEKGPVIVSIVMNDDFGGSWFYHKGVFTGTDCKESDKVNHSVTLVGYGEEGGLKYWLIKNSYGTTWGEDGYGKMQFSVCKILCRISSIVAKPQ